MKNEISLNKIKNNKTREEVLNRVNEINNQYETESIEDILEHIKEHLEWEKKFEQEDPEAYKKWKKKNPESPDELYKKAEELASTVKLRHSKSKLSQ